MQQPTFKFSATISGWEAGSVLADFCKKNKIKHTVEIINGTPERARKRRLTPQMVREIENFVKKNPKLPDAVVVKRMGLTCSPASVWRIRENRHALQKKATK